MRSPGPIQSMRSYGTLLSKNVATDPAPPYPCRDAPHLQVFPCNTSLNIVGTPSIWLYLAFFLIGVGTILPRVVGAYRGVERSLVASGSAVWRRGSGRRPGVDRHQAQPFIRPREICRSLSPKTHAENAMTNRIVRTRSIARILPRLGYLVGSLYLGFHAIDDGRWVFGLE